MTTVARRLRRRRRTTAPAPTSARWDVQGLRAFAVTAVVLDHLLGWPGGGFVGVDVFFVVSGFLITGLLLRERERTGRISFTGFYRRRAKRILPAALLVLAVTVLASRFVLAEPRWRETVVDAAWAACFAANWRFRAQETDYFAAGGPVSPVQHYWSLGIEEQFYVVWPLLLLVALALPLPWAVRRAAAAVVVAGLVAGSFVLALQATRTDVAGAYFSTVTRGWELGCGALLALGVPVLRRIPAALRPGLAWLGLGGLVASVLLVREDAGFPAPAAALPVLATAVVLAAGTRLEHAQLGGCPPLTNRLSRYVGDLSYSLYLWHFPVIVLADAWWGHGQGPYYPVVVTLVAVLSVASYHLVEQPLRHSPFLEPFPSRHQRRRAVREWAGRWAPWWRDAGLAAAAVLAVVLILAVVRGPVAPPAEATTTDYGPLLTHRADGLAGGEAGGSAAGRVVVSRAEQRLADDLTDALRARAWPALHPDVGEVATEALADEGATCGTVDPADPTECSFGDPGDPAVLVVGDSTAITLLPTVRAAYGADHLVRGVTRAGCAFAVDVDYTVAGQATACPAVERGAVAEAARLRPVVTFVTESYGNGAILADGATGTAMQDEWRAGLQDLVDRLARHSGAVVVVSPPPLGPSVQDCATRTSAPADCVYEPAPVWQQVREASAGVTGPRVHFYDTSGWFCAPDGECPSFVGSTLLKRDEVHTTRQWAEQVAPIFAARVDRWLPERRSR